MVEIFHSQTVGFCVNAECVNNDGLTFSITNVKISVQENVGRYSSGDQLIHALKQIYTLELVRTYPCSFKHDATDLFCKFKTLVKTTYFNLLPTEKEMCSNVNIVNCLLCKLRPDHSHISFWTKQTESPDCSITQLLHFSFYAYTKTRVSQNYSWNYIHVQRFLDNYKKDAVMFLI